MSDRYLMLKDDVIINAIMYDGGDYTPPHGVQLVRYDDFPGTKPWIGWTLVGTEWRPPQPYPSWIWDGSAWVAPVPMPDEGGPWVWDEATQSWVEQVAE